MQAGAAEGGGLHAGSVTARAVDATGRARRRASICCAMPDIEPTIEAGGEAFEREYRALHAASLMALFCVGVYAAAFGPVLPFLAADVGISLDTAGLLLTALFVGSISASALIAVVLHARDHAGAGDRRLGRCGDRGRCSSASRRRGRWRWCGGVVLGVGDGLMIAALHVLMRADVARRARRR